jgi:hypothetical protein
MRTCVNCGRALGPDDAFCTGCGAGQPTAGQASPGTGFRPVNAGPEGPPTAPVAAGLAAAAGSTVARGAPGRPAGGAGTAGPANGPTVQAGQAGQTGQAPQPSATTRVGAPPAAAPVAGAAAGARAAETIEQKYLRQTRNATVFIAIIVGIFTAISLIGVIWTATTIAHLDSELNGTFSGVTNSNCLSQGGSNPNC